MAYAPTKTHYEPVSDYVIETDEDSNENGTVREPASSSVLDPVLDTLEAAKRGEILYRSPLTDEQRAARRAFLANPKPTTKELREGLAARRKKGLADNEI